MPARNRFRDFTRQNGRPLGRSSWSNVGSRVRNANLYSKGGILDRSEPYETFPKCCGALRHGEDLMGKKLTLHDVAASAGVSPSTVSRIARGSARVSPEVRDRVLKAASNLSFSLARSNKPKVVTFLLCNRDVLHYFHSRVLAGARRPT